MPLAVLADARFKVYALNLMDQLLQLFLAAAAQKVQKLDFHIHGKEQRKF